MDSVGLKHNRKNRQKSKDKFWTDLQKIPDNEIREHVAKGHNVKILEDSTHSIIIPEYPQWQANKKDKINKMLDELGNY